MQRGTPITDHVSVGTVKGAPARSDQQRTNEGLKDSKKAVKATYGESNLDSVNKTVSWKVKAQPHFGPISNGIQVAGVNTA